MNQGSIYFRVFLVPWTFHGASGVFRDYYTDIQEDIQYYRVVVLFVTYLWV